MSIKYALFENPLTDEKNDWMAIVQGQQSKTIGDVIGRMISRGSTVTKAEALSVLEEFETAIISLLQEGHAVYTPLFRVTTSIKGRFAGLDEGFNGQKHSVNLNVAAGRLISNAATGLQVTKINPVPALPEVFEFKNVATGLANTDISPGGAAQVMGSKLKVDPEDPETGLFFIAEDGATTQVTTWVQNQPSNLIFMVPTGLTEGSYTLEVRTKARAGSALRTGRLGVLLEYSMP